MRGISLFNKKAQWLPVHSNECYLTTAKDMALHYGTIYLLDVHYHFTNDFFPLFLIHDPTLSTSQQYQVCD